jgi:NAD-dependent dihydropyrimidine dehydrogenase PreA subunit
MAANTYLGIPRRLLQWQPTIDTERCIGCGDCRDFCPNDVYALDEATNKMTVAQPLRCVVLCDKCATTCPQEAISFPDKAQFKEVVKELLKRLPRCACSGGGAA